MNINLTVGWLAREFWEQAYLHFAPTDTVHDKYNSAAEAADKALLEWRERWDKKED